MIRFYQKFIFMHKLLMYLKEWQAQGLLDIMQFTHSNYTVQWLFMFNIHWTMQLSPQPILHFITPEMKPYIP